MASRLGPSLLAFSAALLVTSAARAREIEYRAPETCPTRETVVAQIEERAPLGAEITIIIRRDGDVHRGEIAVGEGASRVTRSVEAQACGSVVDALTLVATLDAQPPPAPLQSDAPIVAPPDLRDRPPALPARRSGTQLAFGAGFHAMDVFDRTNLFAPQAFGEIYPALPFAQRSELHPSVRVGFAHSFATTASEVQLPTKFTLLMGTLEACPLGALPLFDEIFAFAACARGELGELQAETSESSSGRAWVAFGTALRTRIYFKRTGVRPLLELGSTLTFPMRRDHYRVIDETVRPSAIVFGGTLAFGVLLP